MDTSTSNSQILVLIIGVTAASCFVISLYALYIAFPRYQKLLKEDEPGVYRRPIFLSEGL